MNVKNLFDAVCTFGSDLTHNRFLTILDVTVNGLISTYGESYVCTNNKTYVKPRIIDTDIPVRDEYYRAIVDTIIYLHTNGDTMFDANAGGRNSDKIQELAFESGNAYKKVWRVKNKNKRIRGGI